MKKTIITTIDVPPGVTLSLGAFIRYYDEGWRYGYLESIKGESVRIRPVGPKNAALPRSVSVPVTDVTAP